MEEHRDNRIAWVWVGLAGIVTAAFAGAIAIDLAPWVRGPAPYPPEWQWLYQPLALAPPSAVLVLSFLVYAVLVALVLHPTVVPWRSVRMRRNTALALGVAGFMALQVAAAWANKGHVLNDIIWHTYEPPGNGYFMTAVRVDDFWQTLHNYAAAMPLFPHHRPQTHPPGIFLFYSAFIALFERLPEFSGWFAAQARSWAPPTQDWVLLRDQYVPAAFFSGLTRWIAACFAPLAFYGFLHRQDRGEDDGRATLALWGALLLPLLPAVTSFFSHWDVNYLLLASAAWYFALRGQDRLHAPDAPRMGRWLDWLWAGLLLSLLTWLSFGNAVICGLVGLHLLWRELVTLRGRAPGYDWRTFGRFVGGAALLTLAVVAPWLLAWAAWGVNYFELLGVGMRMHFELVTAARDLSIWRWMNLVDYALWVGPGVLLLGLVGSIWLIFHTRRGQLESSLAGMALIVWAALLALNLSGTTRGEIGRLWIFLMPFPLIFALPYVRTYWQRVALLGMLTAGAIVLGYVLRALA